MNPFHKLASYINNTGGMLGVVFILYASVMSAIAFYVVKASLN